MKTKAAAVKLMRDQLVVQERVRKEFEALSVAALHAKSQKGDVGAITFAPSTQT